MITVLVTGAGGGVGQGILKSLKMISDLELKIIAADMSELAPGLYSGDIACIVKACSSPDYLESIVDILKKYEVDYYFPGTDVELKFCAINKDLIYNETGCETVISSFDTVSIADDKFLTSKFLSENNLSHPKTFWLKDFKKGLLDYPVIIKPSIGCRSIGVYKVDNDDELLNHQVNTDGIVIQECVGGILDEYTCTVVKVNGQLSPVLALRRELRSGDTFRAMPVKSEIIENYVLDVARRLDIDGGCNFQLRIDQEGIPKIFEINARFSGTTPFCSQLGFNPVEYYIKNKKGIGYEFNIDYDLVVLRFWSEVLVSARDLEELSSNKVIIPKINKQFNLF